jgi:hypothetical protein
MAISKYHHALLFSNWFQYLWKAIYKPTNSYSDQIFHGNDKVGYFCKLSNGLIFKIFRMENIILNEMFSEKSKAQYAVYIYHEQTLIMQYVTYSDSHIFIVSRSPFSYTHTSQVNYLLEALQKILPQDTSLVFTPDRHDLGVLPVFSFHIHSRSEYDRNFFQKVEISHYIKKEGSTSISNMCLFKHNSRFFKAVKTFILAHSFGEDISDSDKKEISNISRNIYSTNNYKLYNLADTTSNLSEKSSYYSNDKLVGSNIGFVIELDNEYHYFIFDKIIMTYYHYSGGRKVNNDSIICRERLEIVFTKKLKETLFMLQKRRPSLAFCQHLGAMDIGEPYKMYKEGLTDEQWLLYEMINI